MHLRPQWRLYTPLSYTITTSDHFHKEFHGSSRIVWKFPSPWQSPQVGKGVWNEFPQSLGAFQAKGFSFRIVWKFPPPWQSPQVGKGVWNGISLNPSPEIKPESLNQLKNLYKRRRFTQCLMFLASRGIEGDAAIFVLSSISWMGGEA